MSECVTANKQACSKQLRLRIKALFPGIAVNLPSPHRMALSLNFESRTIWKIVPAYVHSLCVAMHMNVDEKSFSKRYDLPNRVGLFARLRAIVFIFSAEIVFNVTMRVRGNPTAIRLGVTLWCLFRLGLYLIFADNIFCIGFTLVSAVFGCFIAYMEFFAYVYHAVLGLEEDPFYEDDPMYAVPL